MLSTQNLFWTPVMLQKFKSEWEECPINAEWYREWRSQIYCQGGLPLCHWKQQGVLDSDIEELIKVASEGCQVLLHEAYKRLSGKKMYLQNDGLNDYLANAWDRISTAQLLLARSFYVYIDWHFPEYDDDFTE